MVNFILKTDLSGVRVKALAGGYDHVNDELGIQSLLAASGIPSPAGHVDDGLAWSGDMAAGVQSPNGKGGVTVYGGYRRTFPITEATRDFSACGLMTVDTDFICQGSARSPALGSFTVVDPTTFNPTAPLSLDPSGPGDTLRPLDTRRDAYNAAPYQYFQRSDIRWIGGGFAHYRASDLADFYAQLMFMDDSTVAQLAPSGLFQAPTSNISCSNPLLSADEVQGFCTDAGLGPSDSTLLKIGRRNVEGGPRQYALGHRDYRALAGLRGETGAWTYDLSAQYAAVRMENLILDEVSISRANDALDVVRNAAGALVCATGHPGCVPYDIFAIGGVTRAALDYVSVPETATGSTSEAEFAAVATGQLGDLGIRARGPAMGCRWRWVPERRRNPRVRAGGRAGERRPCQQRPGRPAVQRARSVSRKSIGELRAPLAENMPWLHALTLELGARFSRYDEAGPGWTYKAGAEWAPSADLGLRASYNYAVRAPTVVDLFTPQVIGGGLNEDPCAGANPAASMAACARTGVTPVQYGHITASAEPYNTLGGGNPHLKPEAAATLTFGAVLTPRRLPGLSITVDYVDIAIAQLLSTIGADQIMEQCLQTVASFLLRPGAPRARYGIALDRQGIRDGHRSECRFSWRSERGFWRRPPQESAADRRPRPWRRVLLGAPARPMLFPSLEGRCPARSPMAAPSLYGPICASFLPAGGRPLSLAVEGWSAPAGVDLFATWRYIGPVKLESDLWPIFFLRPCSRAWPRSALAATSMSPPAGAVVADR